MNTDDNNAKTTTQRDRKPVAASNDNQNLRNALRENLSPEAVAAIAHRLTPTPKSGHRELDAEVTWFATLLAETLGGWNQQERIIQELGL